jgi:hypothetical protein
MMPNKFEKTRKIAQNAALKNANFGAEKVLNRLVRENARKDSDLQLLPSLSLEPGVQAKNTLTSFVGKIGK